MDIDYLNDTGNRYEWTCLYCDDTYVVSYHYVDDVWSVQGMRPDGQREIANRNVADQLLLDFPINEALALRASLEKKNETHSLDGRDMPERGDRRPEGPRT